MWATGYGHVDTIAALLAAGAQPNLKDNRGMTALMIASGEGHAAAVTKLLEGGADPSLEDREGKTARDHAAAAGHSAVVELLTATESRRSATADRR
jgi:ankyrin repeat protein